MHGVPTNLPLVKLHGLSLLAVRPLENITYFAFGSGDSGTTQVEIGVEGRWELRKNDRSIVASGNPIPSEASAATAAVGSIVTGSRVQAPESFILVLDEGSELEVFDSSAQYETFSIPQWNVYV